MTRSEFREVVEAKDVHKTASYVHAIRAGNTLFVAGQIGWDKEGNLVGSDAEVQAHQVYENLSRVLRAAGSDWRDVVKIVTYLVDRADSAAVNAVRLGVLGNHRPPHTGVIVAGLGSPEVRLEVEVVAVLEREDGK